MKLYSYWRSSSSWRVRIALHYKQIEHTVHPVHLLRDGGEQNWPAYKTLNPLGRVPCLQFDYKGQRVTLCESLAILELLEEVQPQPALLPSDLFLRGKARQLAQIIGSGIQPLQNLSVLQQVTALGGDKDAWAKACIEAGLAALEREAEKLAGRYLIQDQVSHADACLVPQLYSARRYQVDLSPFPILLRVEAALSEMAAFDRAHADRQPDALKP